MKRWSALVAGLALLLAPAWAAAMTGVFYQPQSRDRDIAAARWPAIFATVHARGFDTLVVQWTRYGPDFGDAAGQQWLADRIQQARSAGLAIVLGLSADPDFFARQEQADGALDSYLRTLARDDTALARGWLDALGADAFVAWYLPLEIDDRRWRDEDALKTLKRHLQREVAALRHVSDRPVYLSSFFAGHATPKRYAHILEELAQAGVRVWVQDGAGSGRLTPNERARYLAQVARCPAPVSHGIAYEVFRQTSPDPAFKAQSLPASEAGRALAQRAPCGGDSLFFELRYLPGLDDAFPE